MGDGFKFENYKLGEFKVIGGAPVPEETDYAEAEAEVIAEETVQTEEKPEKQASNNKKKKKNRYKKFNNNKKQAINPAGDDPEAE